MNQRRILTYSMRVFLLIAPLILLMGCQGDTYDIEAGDVLQLKHGQSAVIANGEEEVRVKFHDILEESRCPQGSQCIWAGRVIVQLQIDGDAYREVGLGDLSSLNPPADLSSSCTIGNILLTLKEADYGARSNMGKAAKYTIVLNTAAI